MCARVCVGGGGGGGGYHSIYVRDFICSIRFRP